MTTDQFTDLLSGNLVYLLGAVFLIVVTLKGVRIVPQSEKHVVERFGRLHSVLVASALPRMGPGRVTPSVEPSDRLEPF